MARERTGVPADVIEPGLAHTVGSQVERAYQRSDLLAKRKRRGADVVDWFED
jgi:hypothetical protein